MSSKTFPSSYNRASRRKIATDVSDPEQRHYLVESQIRQGIPLQLRAMREGRGWTQQALAQKLGTTQNAISRLENPRTGQPAIATLKRIAEVFDVALIVKFAPFSEFVDSLADLSAKSVSVPAYAEEAAEPKPGENGWALGNVITAKAIRRARSPRRTGSRRMATVR
jgi:transcriptional regulator with XRE-family HTH domain